MIKNITLMAVSFIIALVLAEIVLRIVYEPPPKVMEHFRLTESSSYQADPELGWIPKPNIKAEHNRPGSFASQYSTNSMGLRDTEHSLERIEGKQRVVVVGDSFTWGFGINDGEIYTDLLEQLVPDLEVINLGVTNFGLPQEIAYFKRLGVKFKPDALIVAFMQNDVYEPEWIDNYRLTGKIPGVVQDNSEDEAHQLSLVARLKRYLAEKVVVYGLVRDAVNGSPAAVDFLINVGLKNTEGLSGIEMIDPAFGTALREYPAIIDAGWKTIFDDLETLAAQTNAQNIKLVLALIPSHQSVSPAELARSLSYSKLQPTDFDVTKPYRMLEAFGAERGILVINPLAQFTQAISSGQSLYFRGDMHFNAAGHQLFAQRVAQEIAQELAK